MKETSPSQGDFVEVNFEGEFGNQSPIRGRVLEVDTDPVDIPETEMVFVVEDPDGGREIMYSEGVSDGGEWSHISVVNQNLKLGENADWRELE